MSRSIRVLHLAHIGPSVIPSGGRILIEGCLTSELKRGLDSRWLSLRTNRVVGEILDSYSLRIENYLPLKGFPAQAWDHNMAYELARSGETFDFLLSHTQDPVTYIFVLEGPWIWPSLRFFLKFNKHLDYRIVYACHNAEGKLLYEMLTKDDRIAQENAVKSSLMLEWEELDLIRNSQYVTVLNDSEIEHFKNLTNVELVRTKVPSSTRSFSSDNHETLLLSPKIKWHLFSSGDWLPHNEGLLEFLECVINAPVAPNIGFVIVGNILEGMLKLPTFQNMYSKLEDYNIKFMGQVPDSQYAQIESQVSGYILPVKFGGGMGIKTVEALKSGKYVIGTDSAFRGLDTNLISSQITVAEIPELFHETLKMQSRNWVATPSTWWENEELVKSSTNRLMQLVNSLLCEA